MDGEGGDRIRRIRLTGERFVGGRLPVDSLVELQRYQELVRTLARFDWIKDHPAETPPEDFDHGVRLTICRIDAASADVLMDLDRPSDLVEYVDDGLAMLDATLEAAYEGRPLPELPDAISETVRAGAAEFGATLEPGQAIEVYPDFREAPIVVTAEARLEAVERLQLEGFLLEPPTDDGQNVLEKMEATLVGRFTELDADSLNYRFVSLRYGPLKGRYTDPDLTAHIRALLDSADVAPVTRIVGELQYRNGKPWRLRGTSLVEQFNIDNDRWGASLVAFASLGPGWGDGGDGVPIAFTALEAAREVMLSVDAAGAEAPGLFPTPTGGVLIEWSSPDYVRSVEVTPQGRYELFELPAGSFDSTFAETTNLRQAIDFALGGEPEGAT